MIAAFVKFNTDVFLIFLKYFNSTDWTLMANFWTLYVFTHLLVLAIAFHFCVL